MAKGLCLIVLLLSHIVAHAAPLPATLTAWMERQQHYDEQLRHRPRAALQQRLVQVAVSSDQTVRHQAAPQRNINHYGEKVSLNINTATVDEIVAKLDRIGRKKAQAIVDYRTQHGEFSSIDELQQVKGIGAKTIENNRDKIRVH